MVISCSLYSSLSTLELCSFASKTSLYLSQGLKIGDLAQMCLDLLENYQQGKLQPEGDFLQSDELKEGFLLSK